MRGDTRNRWAIIIVLLMAAFFYWDVVTFRGTLFFFDLVALNAPIRRFFFGKLLSGEFPLWCPDVDCGFPLFAEGQLGPLYPLNYPLFPFLHPGVAINLSVILHVVLAIAGSFLYLRRAHSPAAAATGAVTYAFSSYLVFHLIHLNLFQSACLLPWLFLFHDRYLATGRAREIAAAAVVLGAMLTTGQQQGEILALWGLGIYVAALCVDALGGGRRRFAARAAAGTALVALLALGIGAVAVAGILDTLASSVRGAGLSKTDLYGQSLLPHLLVRFASPFHHGRLMNGTWWPGVVSIEKELAVYLGLGAWLLAPVAFVRGGRREDRAHLVVAGMSFLMMLGIAGPFDGLREHVPILAKTRMPGRFVLPLTLSASYLVASGLDALLGGSITPRRAARMLAAGGAAWAVVAWGGALAGYGGDLLAGSPTGTIAGIPVASVMGDLKGDLVFRTGLCAGLAALGMALTRVRTGAARGILALAVCCVCFADLASVGRGENPVGPPEIYRPAGIVEYLRANLGPYRIHADEDSAPLSAGGWSRGTERYRGCIAGLPFFSPLLFDIRTADHGSPLAFGRNTRALHGAANAAMLRQAGVRLILSRRAQPWPPAAVIGGVRVYPLPDPAPLYGLAGEVVPVASPDEALVFLGTPRDDLAAQVVVEPGGGPSPAGRFDRSGTVTVESETTDRRELRVESRGPGFLVFRESWDDSWRATVDGEPVPLLRTNYLFAGLAFPAGSHRVRLEYLPGWFRPTAAVSIVSLLIAAALLLRGGRGRAAMPEVSVPEDEAAARRHLRWLALSFLLLLAIGVLRHPSLWSPAVLLFP